MNTFEHYKRVFDKARFPEAGKPLCNNTRLFKRDDDCLAIRLHQTDVVTVFEDGRIVLSSGGWRTPTTKDRIHTYAPVSVTSDGGVWYITHRKAEIRAEKRVIRERGVDKHFITKTADGGFYLDTWGEGVSEADRQFLSDVQRQMWDARKAERVPFFDGIMFDRNGYCMNGPSPEVWRKYLSERNKMKKRIQTYCTGFNKALAKGIPMPSGGDCWYCSMFDTGNIRGDQFDGDHSHLLSHIEESYYVPSLAVNALRLKGCSDSGIYIHLHMKPEQGIMGGDGYRTNDGSMGGNMVRRAIRDYLCDRLLPEPPSHDPQTHNRPLRANRSTGLQTGR